VCADVSNRAFYDLHVESTCDPSAFHESHSGFPETNSRSDALSVSAPGRRARLPLVKARPPCIREHGTHGMLHLHGRRLDLRGHPSRLRCSTRSLTAHGCLLSSPAAP
jgi:hypothetical protein